MATMAAQVRANTALQLLAGHQPPTVDDDSEDELHADTEPQWEWVYLGDDQRDAPGRHDASAHGPRRESSPSRTPSRPSSRAGPKQPIVGARLGRFIIRVGDTVTLKADRNDVWVAIINKFLDASESDSELEDLVDDADGEDDGGFGSGKKALFTWLSSPKEIRNPRHRRADCLPNELYATANSDVNPLEAIMGRATLLSPAEFLAKFPSGAIPKGHPDNNRVFVCRRGANLRTVTYTDEFKWGLDVMQGQDGAREVRELIDKVERETVATRKRRKGGDTSEGLKDFVVDDEDDQPKTPRKRRKLEAEDGSTPPRKRGPGATPKRTPASKFTTPTHKRIVEKKPLDFTPLGTRILDQDHYLASPHAQARTHLHVASVPASLPCREEEFSTVFTHLESAISDGMGSCIYISGTPGTGKTATVREVVAQLHASVKADELDDFLFVEINGMRLTDPHQSYSMLWEALTGTRVAAGHALTLLGQEFGRPSPRRVPVVVLMDELDQLATRSQGVMYNFFQWPQLRHSRLIVLAVANTMDLPERTLSNKISSRLGLTRIVFQGYTHQQLMKIVETRLENIPNKDVIVDKDAVQFAARKVAGVSGDARRCLDICRRAVEIAEGDAADSPDTGPETPSKTGRAPSTPVGRGRVSIATVQRAIRESTSSPLQQYIRGVPLAAKLFLAAVLARSRRTGVAESTVGEVLDEAKRMGSMSGLSAIGDWLLAETTCDVESRPGDARRKKGLARADPNSDTLTKVPVPRVLGIGSAMTELIDAGIVVVEERRGERTARCRLLISEEDVKGALRGDEEVKGLGFSQ